MTAKFLNNYPVKNAVRIISQNRKFAIVTCILSLLGIPLMIGTAMISSYLEILDTHNDYYHSFEATPYVVIGGFCAGIAVFLGFFCGIRAFEEEWNKTKVDMLYSLPLNGTQRFFSNYIGGFMMYTVPYIVSVLLGWIILLIMSPLIISNVGAPTAEEFHEFYLYYFLGSLGLFALMCMYYTISAVCASCCGTLFENIYTNILLNLLIPGTCAAVLAVITNEVSGLDFEYSWDFIGYISPVGGLIYLIYLLIEKGIDFDSSYTSSYQAYGGSSENSGLIPAYTRWIIVIILLTAALLVLAWKLYQHRKAEHVSKPFVYIWLYYLIISAVTACILCIGAADADALFAVILFSAIVYFIMEVIRKRGFKKFWLSVVTYIVTIAIAIGGYNLITATECFGRTKYIPPVGTVTSVDISFRETGLRGYDAADYHLTYKDRETISKIQEFQRNYIQNHYDFTKQLDALCTEYHYQLQYNYNAALESYENYDYKTTDSDWGYYNCFETTSFTITYHTIAGTSIHRSYDLYADEYFDLVKVYAGTEAYAQASASLLKSRLTSDIRKYNDKTHAYEIPDNASFDVTYLEDDTSGADQKINLSHAEADITALADAYRTDMQNLSFDNLCKDQILGYIKKLPVYESCTETAAFLKERGFIEIKTAEILFNGQAANTSYNNRSILDIRIYAPENYRTCSLHYPSYVTNAWNTVVFSQPDNFAWRDIVPAHGSGTAKQYYPELYAVLNHARRNYISAEPCYLIVINGSYYLIPAEYSEEVKQITNLGMYYYSSLPLNSYNFSSRSNYQF